MDFVHLHVQTQYSLLDSAIRVSPLMDQVKDFGMNAVAITDHGAMFGALDFQLAAQKAGLKSIIGLNAYMTDNRKDLSEITTYHITLIAKNLVGYKNLIFLNSMAWIEGLYKDRFQTIPRIDFELLSKHKDGIICLSGDLGSQLSRSILRGNLDDAREIVQKYKSLFGPDHYYLELIRASLPEFDNVADTLIEFSEEMNVPVVATNDCHYLYKKDALAHAVLMAIQLERTIEIETALSHKMTDLYLKSPEEMYKLFEDIPVACENTVKIAEMCDLKIPTSDIYLPLFDLPDSFPRQEGLSKEELISNYFAHLSREGLKERLAEFDELHFPYDASIYWARLEDEIKTIQSMKFPGYFLIVADFIAWAKSQKIPVGPGRGSGAGSLVAYSLKITDINPIPYDLLFERFLNPERVSMPDFDIDFCTRRRGEVIDYVTKKYGENNVAQIATFGQLKTRAVLRDVGRALKVPLSLVDKVAKLIPDDLKVTLETALKTEKELVKLREENEMVDKMFELAMPLEGLYRQAGVHAAGIVISDGPLWDYVPVFRGTKNEIVSQFAKNEVEKAGLVKFDFLGLKTLTVIDDAVRLIDQQRADAGEKPFDLRTIPMDDQKVFDLISSGNTTGIFQLESQGFTRLIMRLRPDRFDDIIAAVALYRPGPLGSGMVDDYINCKHARQEVTYPHPSLSEVLKPTYGVILYQEQVMNTARVIAGYSLGQADLLRRAMGKKKADVMAAQRIPFIEGAAKTQGLSEDKAKEIFSTLEKFAEYGFNKSHSAAYALLTYQTAWLKTYYNVEFMAALMTNDRDNTDKVVRFINEARSMGIEVLSPDVNYSELDFSVKDGKIRFGLGAVKGVGSNVIGAIVDAREKEPFSSLYDFCAKVDSAIINKKTIEALILCGAFDSIAPNHSNNSSLASIASCRAAMLAAIPTALEHGSKKQHDLEVGQYSLFGSFSQVHKDEFLQEYYPNNTMTEREALDAEKSTLGFYVSGHPLDRYQSAFEMLGTSNTSDIEDGKFSDRQEVVLAGLVGELRETILKDNKGKMASFQFEDLRGSVSVTAFRNYYEDFYEVLKSGEPILLVGTIRERHLEENVQYEVNMSSAKLLTTERDEKVQKLQVRLNFNDITNDKILKLKSTIDSFPGHSCDVEILVSNTTEQGEMTAHFNNFSSQVMLVDDLLCKIEHIFGRKVVVLS